MIKYGIAKLLTWFIFFIFIGIPFFCVAIIYHSKAIAFMGMASASIISLWVILSGFNRFSRSLDACPVDPDSPLATALARIGNARTDSAIQVRVFQNSDPLVKYWVTFTRSVIIFISQGTATTLTEIELKQLMGNAMALRQSALSRRQATLKQELWSIEWALSQVKGEAMTFRYWFFSFWLLPFEKTLNFASHLL